MTDVTVVTVPGVFVYGQSLVDIETEKVPADYTNERGEHFRRRWSAFMIGVARDGEVRIIEGADERDVLAKAADAISGGPVVYSATREFDEMVLKGRFTNARRAHAPRAYYPALPGAAGMDWFNVWQADQVYPMPPRGDDVLSKYVPEIYHFDPALVRAHNLRDVAELILVAGAPDDECRAWCVRVLADTDYALSLVR